MKKIDYSGNTMYTGRELYDAHFTSTLNRKPVGNLTTHVKSCYEGNELNPSLDDMLTYLLVDGSLIVYNGSFAEGIILYINEKEAVIKRGDIYTHIMQQGNQTYITDFAEYDDKADNLVDALKEQLTDVVIVPSKIVVLYPNGNGILYDCQKTLLRIEEIYYTLAQTTPMESMIFVKDMANSIDKTNATISSKLKTNQPLVPLNGEIQQPNFGNLTNRLFNELKILEPNWMEATFNYYTFPNESGIARAYAMARFLSKATELKKQCSDIYAKLGYKITFKPSDITEQEEDNKKLESIYIALDRGIITSEEASPMIREILGFID